MKLKVKTRILQVMPSFIFLLSKVSMTENASWHRFYLYVGIIFCWLLYRQFIDLEILFSAT